MSKRIQQVLSHDVMPLCLDCKQIAEQHNVRYKMRVISRKLSLYEQTASSNNDNASEASEQANSSGNTEEKRLSDEERRILVKNARILERNIEQMPQERRQELLAPLRKYFQTGVISQEQLNAAKQLETKKKHGTAVCEYILSDPKQLYDFVVGWRTHFVRSLCPAKLSPDWLANANAKLAEELNLSIVS